MAYGYERANEMAYRLSRMETGAPDPAMATPLPLVAVSGEDPLAAFAYRDPLDDLAEQIHLHDAGCCCQARGE